MNKTILIASALLLSTTACGPSFQAKSVASKTGATCLSQDCTSQVPVDPAQEAWNKLEINGAISSGTHKTAPVIRLDKPNKMLLVSLPMPLALPTAAVPIPDLEGGKLTWEKLPDGTPALVLHIPLEKLLRGVDFPAVDRLPTGHRLADLGVPDGELPSFAVALPIRNVKANLYVGAGVVAIFVNTPWSPPIGIGPIPIKDSKKTTTLGYFALLPGNTSSTGGVYVSAQMPDAIARIIDDIL